MVWEWCPSSWRIPVYCNFARKSKRIDPAQEKAWRRLQAELAENLPNGTLIIAEESDHVIHMDQPDLVVDAIRRIVEQTG
jgi:pimeloyl-ACP methyl ester carboxylesterase